MKTYRILVTGWRDWPEEAKLLVWHRLNEYVARHEGPAEFVLIHGQCPYGGVDEYAEQWAIARGFKVEPYPARVVNGKILGPERNALMISKGADICLGFPGPNSRGTRNCMRLAKAAGIPVEKLDWPGQ